MDLSKLKKEIPYRWRVQSYSKNKPSAACVAYIDARDVMDILDEVCGAGNWQDDYRVVDGKLFAGIGIKVTSETGWEWVWKWDTGTESQTEKDKGKVSDSFKRAAVKWGVGRFLYGLKIQYLPTSGKKTDHTYPYVIDDKSNKVGDIADEINKRGVK